MRTAIRGTNPMMQQQHTLLCQFTVACQAAAERPADGDRSFIFGGRDLSCVRTGAAGATVGRGAVFVSRSVPLNTTQTCTVYDTHDFSMSTSFAATVRRARLYTE